MAQMNLSAEIWSVDLWTCNLGGVLGPRPSKTALLNGKPREMQMSVETAEQTRGSYYRRMSLLSHILQ